MNETAVMLALKDHFKSPEYALLPQVRNRTGFSGNIRTADAIAMGLWPSRGIYMHGIEIKVSRRDWQKEKVSPVKAEEIARYCDYWWVAVPDGSIVKDAELPENWGLLTCSGPKVKITKPACLNAKSDPVSKDFLAAIFRKVTETRKDFTGVEDEIERRAKKKLEEYKQHVAITVDLDTKTKLLELEKLQQAVRTFEEASGIKLNTYSDHFNKQIGEAVKLLKDQNKNSLQKLSTVEGLVSNLLSDISAQRAAIETVINDAS